MATKGLTDAERADIVTGNQPVPPAHESNRTDVNAPEGPPRSEPVIDPVSPDTRAVDAEPDGTASPARVVDPFAGDEFAGRADLAFNGTVDDRRLTREPAKPLTKDQLMEERARLEGVTWNEGRNQTRIEEINVLLAGLPA